MPGQDVSKAHYRLAQAHEALAKAAVKPAKRLERLGLAVEALRAGIGAAKASEEARADQAGEVVTPSSSSANHLQRELRRLKEEEKAAKKAADEAAEQEGREKAAESKRGLGVAMEDAKPASQSAMVHLPTVGYVRDIDLSKFAEGWLARELASVKHTWADGGVSVQELVAGGSEIHASVKEKRGKRALYYDLSLQVTWVGRSKLGRSTHAEMSGVMKLYNIGQDTRFQLGGDKETSYMYEVGYLPQYHAATEPWATQVKEEVSELFEIIATLIVKQFVPALEAKGKGVK